VSIEQAMMAVGIAGVVGLFILANAVATVAERLQEMVYEQRELRAALGRITFDVKHSDGLSRTMELSQKLNSEQP